MKSKKSELIEYLAQVKTCQYIRTLRSGKTPARIADQIQANKYDLLDRFDLRSRRTSKACESIINAITMSAKSMIAHDLRNNPELLEMLRNARS